MAAGQQPVEPHARAGPAIAVHDARAGRDGVRQILQPARVAGRHDESLLPVRQGDEHERAAGEQRPRVGLVEVAGLGVEEVAPGGVADAVPQGDEALETAHRHGDHVRARLVLAEPAGQQVERAVVAPQEDEQPALPLVRQHHEVDRVRPGRGAVELLHVALGRPRLHQLHEPGLLEAQDVVAYPGGVVADDDAELRQRRRTAHEQAQQAQALLVGEHADGVDGADVTDLFHRGSLWRSHAKSDFRVRSVAARAQAVNRIPVSRGEQPRRCRRPGDVGPSPWESGRRARRAGTRSRGRPPPRCPRGPA